MFCIIRHFHSTKNIAVDIIHDLLEGICRYDIARLLNYFIFVICIISLDDFNSKLRAFDYGPGYNVNKPPELTEKSIKNGYIILSSAEMLNLVLNINLIIGPLANVDCKFWQMYLSLREILLIVFSTKLRPSTYQNLEKSIFEYLSLHALHFPMKPKHHFLLHYPRCMKLFGPHSKIFCLRFESKNQEGKAIAKTSPNRTNVNRTIAVKHQLDLNYRFMTKQGSELIFSSKNHKSKLVTSLPLYEKYSFLINTQSVVSVRSVSFYDKII